MSEDNKAVVIDASGTGQAAAAVPTPFTERAGGVDMEVADLGRALADVLAGLGPVRERVVAVGVARGARYLALGVLAIYYGDAALELMRTQGQVVALWLAGLIVVGALAFWLWKRRRQVRPMEAE